MENNHGKDCQEITICFFLFFVFLSVGAQSKPKRDITKDRKPVTFVPKVQKSIPRFVEKK